MRNRVQGEIPCGSCFQCNKTIFDKTVVYFGPGAYMKCGPCGSWSPEQMREAQRRLQLHAEAFITAVTSHDPT